MPGQRPFRFGVQMHRAGSRDEWKAKAQKAENLGYATLSMPDHLGEFLAFGPALSATASATTTLRVGTFVLDNDFRHPALVAREAATLDLLSGGRFELGIGAGWDSADYEQSGIPFDPPGVRVSRLEESVRVIKGLFADTPVSFAGQHYTITDLAGFPLPVQRPHPPILIGAGGERMLSLGAQEADIVSLLAQARPDGSGFVLADTTAEATQRKIAWLRQKAGDRFGGLELNILLQRLVVTDDTGLAAEELSEEWQMTPEEVLDVPYILIGSVEQIVETLRARRDRYGISYVVVFERFMDEFAPIVAQLTGT